jgi:hypothetical protein
MDQLEEQIGAILSNPQLMQQITSMAQSLGQGKPDDTAPHPQKQPQGKASAFPSLEGIDMASIQKIAGLTQRSQIDSNQRSLLRALSPYLSKDRIGKLEKAMRAAKVAAVASTALQLGAGNFSRGR